MQGFYLLVILLACAFAIDGELTSRILTATSLKMQVWWINWRMKCHARKLHRQLSADMKKHFGSEVPPFQWVDLWERDQ